MKWKMKWKLGLYKGYIGDREKRHEGVLVWLSGANATSSRVHLFGRVFYKPGSRGKVVHLGLRVVGKVRKLGM